VSLKMPKAVFSASEREYTAVGGDVHVPIGMVFTSDENRNKGLIHGLVKQRQFCMSLLLRGDDTGAFKESKAFGYFLHRSLFRSSPVAMNLM